MNPFTGSFSTNPGSQNQQNPSNNPFPGQKELMGLPFDLQSKILSSLQQKQPQGNQFKTPKVLHPPPDAGDLGAYQTTKKFKGNDSSLTIPSDPLAGFPQFMNAMPNHKPLDFPMQRDQGFPPDLRYLGLDPQAQGGLLEKNPMLANLSILESMNKRQMPILPQSNYFGGNLFAPDARGQKPADSLVMPDELPVNMNNASREQSLKNLLLLQALQGQNDVLPNMYSPFQQQLQMLNNPQLQGLQSMGMPFNAGGNLNPLLALQYLEMQKRMETEYAVMQAKNQMLQSLQNSDLQHQGGMQLPEGLTSRNPLESSLLARGGLRPDAFGNFKDPRAQNEHPDRQQLHKPNESLLLRRGNLNQANLTKEEHSLFQQQQQQQQQHQQAALAGRKLQENKNIIIPKAEPAHPSHIEREVKKINEVKMESHAEPQRELPRNQRREPIQPVKENPKPIVPEIQRPKTTDIAPPVRESRKPAKNRDVNYTDFKEMKEAQAIKASDERARRRQQREEASGLQKPLPVVAPKPEIKKEPLIVGIIQPKELFSKIFNQKYNIQVQAPGQPLSTNFKRISLGKNHQVNVNELEINDYRYNQEPKKTLKLVSTPKVFFGEIIDGKKHIPLDFDPMALKEPKQIHVGDEYQAKIADFDLNLEEEKRKRLCRLLSNPQSNLNSHLQSNGLESA